MVCEVRGAQFHGAARGNDGAITKGGGTAGDSPARWCGCTPTARKRNIGSCSYDKGGFLAAKRIPRDRLVLLAGKAISDGKNRSSVV